MSALEKPDSADGTWLLPLGAVGVESGYGLE